MYGIYKMYNNECLVYVGKTNNLFRRLNEHLRRREWTKEITHIELAECKSKSDMDIYEKYYIDRLKPRSNKVIYTDPPEFEMEELTFIRYTFDDFVKENSRTEQEYLTTINKKQKEKRCIITIELDEETFKKFKKKADEKGIVMAKWLRLKIEEFIKENE